MLTKEEYSELASKGYDEYQAWVKDRAIPPAQDPIDVCCHTHHKDPGQPCGFQGRQQDPCRTRVRHFEAQQTLGYRSCIVCIGHISSKNWSK